MLTLSETSRALNVLDQEIAQLEADLRSVRWHQHILDEQASSIQRKMETLRNVAKAILTGEIE